MSSVVRLRYPPTNPVHLSVPSINSANADACRRLDALELLISNEPDPVTRTLYVRRFHEIWEQVVGGER
ncbi:MAG: hypothetical protein NXI27_25415 [Alphaproteobacteria bacterium]|nr:hypothetical protein [Alphaproteobacteria bacterium]